MNNKAIYLGSFNPFHVGHKNILEKAELIFDEVIVAYGNDHTKDYSSRIIPKFLDNKKVEIFNSSIPQYLNSKDYNPTLIRGIRNFNDFELETKQIRWLQLLKPDLKIVFIPCDKEFEHISSSDIKKCQSYSDLKILAEDYIVK